MKVILIQDMENLGAAQEVVNVKPGYARNFLIPRKIALEATASNLKVLEEKNKVLAKKQAEHLVNIQATADKLSQLNLTIKVKVNSSGRVFGAVTTILIAKELKLQANIIIDRKTIAIDENIKELGHYKATITLSPKLTAVVGFDLIPE